MNYYRNRPFLIINYLFRPADGQNTSQKNFGSTGRFNAIEQMIIADSLTKKHLTHSELIIDIFEQKIVKNRSLPGSETELVDKFTTKYIEDVKEALSTWIARNPSNLDRIKDYLEKSKLKAETNNDIGADNVEGDSN